MLIRYVILSPSEEARQAFLGSLFGRFELSPRGRGEKVNMSIEGFELEVVGTGLPGKLKEMMVRLLQAGVQVDGILMLIPSGDEDSWAEARAIAEWVQSGETPVVLKNWVFGDLDDLEKETSRKALLTLISEQEKFLTSA